MTDDAGWFDGLDVTAATVVGTETADERAKEDAVRAIRGGSAADPDEWPTLAVEAGFAEDREAYYDALATATRAATREAVNERERADDRQLVHAIRAMDDCTRTANELCERLAEWAETVDSGAEVSVEYARSLMEESGSPVDEHPRLRSLAERVVDLDEEADELRSFVEERAPSAAPNLSALAGPLLATRLISLAGGLESLAKKPSGTVQVLGAEDALFAHLRGHAPSPKHGVIYTHDAVRGTRKEDRGSAARALAGKLTIAARVDHYSGEYRPDVEAELTERIARIQARGEGE